MPIPKLLIDCDITISLSDALQEMKCNSILLVDYQYTALHFETVL